MYIRIHVHIGKNPTVVFDDADLSEAIPGVIMASFANQGEICLCGERLFVQVCVCVRVCMCMCVCVCVEEREGFHMMVVWEKSDNAIAS